MKYTVEYSNIQADLIRDMGLAVGNGEVGRKALKVALDAVAKAYEAGRKDVEREVRRVWTEGHSERWSER